MLIFQRCRVTIGLALLGCAAAWATPPLTIIQDILFNADSTRFNGVATITWPSFEASDYANIPAGSLTTQIVGGLLRVQLVPTTTALTAVTYTVTYNSNGLSQFTETWAVPASNIPVRVNAIRVAPAGTTVGGGGGGVGGITSVNISDVIGLSGALALKVNLGSGYTPSRAAIIDATGALDGALGNASDCLHVDGSSGACATGGGGGTSSPVFIDGEVPTGSSNGTNSVFQLGAAPSPTASLTLFRNGLLLKQGSDYSLNGNQVTFNSNTLPQINDVLVASYRMGTVPTGFVFYDSEVPGGAVNGSNATFTLIQSPNPVASLSLFRNGIRMRAVLDFNLLGGTLVFVNAQIPQLGDVLVCSYRH